MILIDTSVWIEVFRRGASVIAGVPRAEVVTCLPVIQEILQGMDEERQYRIARDAMFAFPVIEAPLEDEVFLEAVGLYRAARRAGLTVRSSVDCLIAACAIRHDAEVLHRDRDFRTLARVSPLRQRRV